MARLSIEQDTRGILTLSPPSDAEPLLPHLHAMQQIEVKSLGYKLTKSVPSSVEEFDSMAKETGAALREANRNVLYRSTLAEFRNVFLHGRDAEGKAGEDGAVPAIEGLDKLTGIERKTKVTKPEVRDADGKITQEQVEAWDETEDEFENRVMATIGSNGTYPSVDAAKAAYAPHAQAVLDQVVFDPSKTERKSAGPKKTPQTYVEVANEIVKATGSIEAAVAAFTRKTGVAVASATIDALAKAVWDDQKSQKKKIAAGYAAA